MIPCFTIHSLWKGHNWKTNKSSSPQREREEILIGDWPQEENGPLKDESTDTHIWLETSLHPPTHSPEEKAVQALNYAQPWDQATLIPLVFIHFAGDTNTFLDLLYSNSDMGSALVIALNIWGSTPPLHVPLSMRKPAFYQHCLSLLYPWDYLPDLYTQGGRCITV